MRRWFGVILGLVSLFGAVAKLRADAQMVAQGYVVPGVYYADLGNTSAVGLTNVCRFNIAVYWVLADADDTVRARGGFVLEKEHVVPFVLAALSRQVSADPAAQAATLPPYERGVLIFAADTDGDGALRASDRACLLAEAFHADVVAGDAVYIPVWPFSAEDIQPIPRISPPFPPAGIDDLSNMGAAPLTTLSSGIVDEVGQPGAVGYARFALGGEDRTSGYSREKYGLSGKVVWTRVVLPDCRGPRIVTTGYSAAHSTSSFVISRSIMPFTACFCANRKWNF